MREHTGNCVVAGAVPTFAMGSNTPSSNSSYDNKDSGINATNSRKRKDRKASCLFTDYMTEELIVQVAEYLDAQDLFQYQCTCKDVWHVIGIGTDYGEELWEGLCYKRWESWPRYCLTDERRDAILTQHLNTSNDDDSPSSTSNSTSNSNHSTSLAVLLQNTSSWKQRYDIVEMDATRTTLRLSDLIDRKWYLSFALMGVGRSDFMQIRFQPPADENAAHPYLFAPGYPPLPYRIMDTSISAPPASDTRVLSKIHGDRPFSKTQWLQVSDFPPHYITRKSADAEWLIVNGNVIIVSHS